MSGPWKSGKRLRAIMARFKQKSSARDRAATLSNIDWVIEMLHRVRTEKPEITAQWWENLKGSVLGRSREKHGNEGGDH